MHPTHELILNLPEHDHHHLVTFLHDEATGMEAFVAVHRKNANVPSFGATRMWHYKTDTEALRDALRLSKLMSYKGALAGLPCGGAKGVIIGRDEYDRNAVLHSYAEKIALLKDSFITGTDVGISQADLTVMKSKTPNIIGFNDNTTEFTGLGVYRGILSALGNRFGDNSLSSRTFALQGLGKIGEAVLNRIAHDARKIYVSDLDPEALQKITMYKNVEVVSPDVIHKIEVDVFSPCAMGGMLNMKTVADLRCSIVVGGANNQLESDEVGDILHKMNILYAPDYIVNAGGLIAVFDEYEYPDGYDHQRVEDKVLEIGTRLDSVFAERSHSDRATNRIANELAESIFNAYV